VLPAAFQDMGVEVVEQVSKSPGALSIKFWPGGERMDTFGWMPSASVTFVIPGPLLRVGKSEEMSFFSSL